MTLVTGPRSSPQSWREFDMVLVRAETTDGVVGWGDCFAYSCLRPVLAAAQDMVFPLALGRTVTNIAELNTELQFKLHIFGRYGIEFLRFRASTLRCGTSRQKMRAVHSARLSRHSSQRRVRLRQPCFAMPTLRWSRRSQGARLAKAIVTSNCTRSRSIRSRPGDERSATISGL